MRAVVFGAGSIGKSVAAYCASKAGAEVTLTDVAPASVEDLKRRGHYRIYESKVQYETVSGINAVYISDAVQIAADADVVFTAVGQKGLADVLHLLAQALRIRTSELALLPIILCENIAHCYDYARTLMKKESAPLRFSLIDSSVERMTKPHFGEDGARDVLAEPFIPLILNRSRYGDIKFIAENPQVFFETDCFHAYYSRKIYTNNLGHAILGFGGYEKGYRFLADALKDAEIHQWLTECLEIEGETLRLIEGFSETEVSEHLRSLMVRFSNPNLEDEVLRVINNPIRKLLPDERIIGAGLRAEKCGLSVKPFARLAAAALWYSRAEDEESVKLQMLLKTSAQSVLEDICGLSMESHLAVEIIRYLHEDRPLCKNQKQIRGGGLSNA